MLPPYEAEARERLKTSTGGSDPRPMAKFPEADKGTRESRYCRTSQYGPGGGQGCHGVFEALGKFVRIQHRQEGGVLLARLLTLLLIVWETGLIAAQAASSTQQTSNPTAPLGLLVGVVCYGRRKKPIGGWLLFFFWSVFSGGVISAIFMDIKSFLPETWNDPLLYSLSLASTVPSLVAELCLIVAAIALLRIRTWSWVVRIRWILAAMILCELIGLLIDTKYFPDNLFLDGYSLILPSVFLPYMFRSKRVSLVFLTKNWAEVAFLWPKVKEAPPITSQ
jgi:hypothetical protein